MHASIALPFIDADRMNPSGGKGGGKLGARGWIVAAYVAAFALWMCWRLFLR
jgi:hypothetical protein